jgi:glycosyltransferase involved in cell wall biosynthesis
VKIALYEINVTTSVGGIQNSCWETARRLAQWGHEVHLYGGEGPIRWEGPENLKILTFPYIPRTRFPNLGTRFQKAAERVSFFRHTRRSLIENRYNIIYIRKPYEIPMALYVRRRTGAKVVFRSGGTEFFPGYGYCASRLDAFLGVSKHNARQIYDYCGLEPRVLYEGVDTERFVPRPKNRKLLAKYGLGENERVLISIGRLAGLKGFQYGLQALNLLGDEKIRYLIVGEGGYREELVTLANKEGLSQQVVFTGPVDNQAVPSYYSLADLALFPSLDEALNIAALEALASGVPAIGTLKTGLSEAIVDGQTGFLVPPRDPRLLAEKIQIIFKDQELRFKMGRQARQRALENFSWDVIVKQLEERFQELCQSGAGKPPEPVDPTDSGDMVGGI